MNYLGGNVLSCSDSNGTLVDLHGITNEKLTYIKEIKNNQRERIHKYLKKYPKAKYYEGAKPWSVVK